MNYLWFIVLVLLAGCIGAIIHSRLSKNKNSTVEIPDVDEKKDMIPIAKDDIAIKFEMLPVGTEINENSLVEISDSKVLAKINNLIPQVAQTGNNIADAIRANNSDILYRAVIPVGEKLSNSKTMEGAVRGIYHGANGIKGSANLVAVNTQNSVTVARNTMAASMNIASVVVGQYYMTQINNQLDGINDNIKTISNFQDNEYKGKVFALLQSVKSIAEFKVEILENEELKNRNLSQLDNLEKTCKELLSQANFTLEEIAKKQDIDFDFYESKIIEADKWYMYQQMLENILQQIVELRYVLYNGSVSKEYCFSELPTYVKLGENVQKKLKQWHQEMILKFDINTSEQNRGRKGIDKAIHVVPGIFNKKLKYKDIPSSTAKMIESQINGIYTNSVDEQPDLYSKDVQLISKNGKIYYLPEQN